MDRFQSDVNTEHMRMIHRGGGEEIVEQLQKFRSLENAVALLRANHNFDDDTNEICAYIVSHPQLQSSALIRRFKSLHGMLQV
jgi:hypothetical protein